MWWCWARGRPGSDRSSSRAVSSGSSAQFTTEAVVTMASVVRFPVVLFDLDGTVVDSGAIILASMRHATREVLGSEHTDEELMQAVGGPGLEAQLGVFGPNDVDELVRVYR